MPSFTLISLCLTLAGSALASPAVQTRRQAAIANEYIVEFNNEEAAAQILTDTKNAETVQKLLKKKYQTKLRGAEFRGGFQKQKADVLLVKTADKMYLDTIRQMGGRVFPNKLVRKVDIQRPAPWNLAVLSPDLTNF